MNLELFPVRGRKEGVKRNFVEEEFLHGLSIENSDSKTVETGGRFHSLLESVCTYSVDITTKVYV